MGRARLCGADLRLKALRHADTSRSCKTSDTGASVSRSFLFTSQLSPVPIYTGWYQRHIGANMLPRVILFESDPAGNRTHYRPYHLI